MPNRILREGILSSERIAQLAWAEEVFYRRLMSVVDDFGRYYAHPSLLHAALYPLQLGKVSDSDIGKWLTACVDAALVRVYPAQDGKRYLELLDFRQQVRAKESKFPAFDPQLLDMRQAAAKRMHSKRAADAPVFGDGDGGVSGDGGVEPSASSPGATLPACPHEEIIALYHEVLPSLPRVKYLKDTRRRAVAGFWKWILTSKKSDGSRRATTREEGLTWLRGYFGRASENDFLMGRTPRSAGHERWECDLDFLVSDRGLKHVIEKTREAA